MNLSEIIQSTEPKFQKINRQSGNLLNFEKECLFAKQQLLKNDELAQAAKNNPNSLMGAIINVAAIGISLNPATAHAYLVPRDRKISEKEYITDVCLDISYRGLIKLATDTGVIKWARAQVVHKNDAFVYRGPVTEPTFETNPFEDRGDKVGVYCVAKTADGDFLVGVMTKIEIDEIKKCSKSAHSKYSPWNKFESEMWKKVIIKRESKTWPQSDGRQRLDHAIEVINEHEGIDFFKKHTDEQYTLYSKAIKNGDDLMFAALLYAWDNEVLASLNTAYKKEWPGTVADLTNIMKLLEADGHDKAIGYGYQIDECFESGDDVALIQLFEELDGYEYTYVIQKYEGKNISPSDTVADIIEKCRSNQ